MGMMDGVEMGSKGQGEAKVYDVSLGLVGHVT